MRFDGSAAYLLAGWLNTSPVTWSAWLYPRALPAAAAGIVGFQEAGGAHDKTLHLLSGGTVQFHAYDGVDRTATSITVLPLYQWTHIAATADGSNIRIYVRGLLEATTACGATYTSYNGANLRAGGGLRESGSVTNRFLDGDLRDVALWSAALTEAQIREVATGLWRPGAIRPDALIAEWPLRIGEGADPSRWPNKQGVVGTNEMVRQAGSTWPNETPIAAGDLTPPILLGLSTLIGAQLSGAALGV